MLAQFLTGRDNGAETGGPLLRNLDAGQLGGAVEILGLSLKKHISM